MDTPAKKFIASPTMDKLRGLRKLELLEVASELGIGDVKSYQNKSVIREYIGIHYHKESAFSNEELKQLSDDASSAGKVTPLQIEKLKLDYVTILMNLKVVMEPNNEEKNSKKINPSDNPKCLLLINKNQKISRNERCEATGKKFKNCCGAL